MSETPETLPAPAPTPSRPPRAKTTAQAWAETVVDVVAIVGVIALALKGRVDGTLAILVASLLAGVRITDLVGIRGNGGGPGAGGMTGAIVGLLTSVAARAGHS